MKVAKSRTEALQYDLKTFATGKPCANGHLAPRSTRTGHCLECRKSEPRRKGLKKAGIASNRPQFEIDRSAAAAAMRQGSMYQSLLQTADYLGAEFYVWLTLNTVPATKQIPQLWLVPLLEEEETSA